MDRAMIITPLSLLELNLKHAIVLILNKPQWHNKWQDPVIRAKWFSEIRAGFISKIYDECLQWSREYGIPAFDHLFELIHTPYSAEKEAEAQEWSLFVRYELVYYIGKYKRELPGSQGRKAQWWNIPSSGVKTKTRKAKKRKKMKKKGNDRTRDRIRDRNQSPDMMGYMATAPT